MPIYEVAVSVDYAGPGSPGANVWHVRTIAESGTGSAEPLGQALQVLTEFYEEMATEFPQTSVWRVGETVTQIDGENRLTIPNTPNTVNGTGGGELPERLAVLVKLQSPSGGRRGQGRKFFGPLATVALESNGTVVETTREHFQDSLNDLIASSMENADGWALCIWSRLDSLGRDIVSATVDNEFAQLSSRRF